MLCRSFVHFGSYVIFHSKKSPNSRVAISAASINDVTNRECSMGYNYNSGVILCNHSLRLQSVESPYLLLLIKYLYGP